MMIQHQHTRDTNIHEDLEHSNQHFITECRALFSEIFLISWAKLVASMRHWQAHTRTTYSYIHIHKDEHEPFKTSIGTWTNSFRMNSMSFWRYSIEGGLAHSRIENCSKFPYLQNVSLLLCKLHNLHEGYHVHMVKLSLETNSTYYSIRVFCHYAQYDWWELTYNLCDDSLIGR